MGARKLSYYREEEETEKIFFSSAEGERLETLAIFKKRYVKDNHLGNVMVVVSDRKLAVDDRTSTDVNGNPVGAPDGIMDFYEPDVLSAVDRYPGGSEMPGRTFQSNVYRYGYNQGSEKDDEIASVSGAHITTYFREYDTRLNRTWSIDPKGSQMPWQSPYVSMDNNPILYNDPLGDKVKYKKFGDRVRVGISRLFNRKFNADFKSKKGDQLNTFTYDKSGNSPRLKDAKASWNLLDAPVDGRGTLADQYDVKYNWGLGDGVGIGSGFKLSIDWGKLSLSQTGEKDVERRREQPNGTVATYRLRRYVPGSDITLNSLGYPDWFTATDGNGNNFYGPSVSVGVNRPNSTYLDPSGNVIPVSKPVIQTTTAGTVIIKTWSITGWPRLNKSPDTNEPSSITKIKYTKKTGINISIPYPKGIRFK